MSRVFLLSPASTTGKRARILMNERAEFELARKLRADGASIGEIFTFLSGLYFRGKLAYSQKFANPPRDVASSLVITAGRGILPSSLRLNLSELREFSEVEISLKDGRYLEPFRRDLKELEKKLKPHSEVVLLGSIATDKYLSPLLERFGTRLFYPCDFLGRGDMSRGALMLRAVQAGQELSYQAASHLV